MLPKPYRLKHKRDFDTLFEKGRFVAGGLVNAKVWKIDTAAFPKRDYDVKDVKFGFVVGKKTIKGAVKRNKIKRQMRESVRLMLKKSQPNTGYLVALIATPQIASASYVAIEESIKKVLSKAKILN